MEIARFIRNERGEFTFSAAFRLLALALLGAVMLEVMHVYFTIGSVREKVNESVLAVASANVAEFYGGARESDGYARHVVGNSFASAVNTDNVIDTLARDCGATSVDESGHIVVRDSYELQGINTRYVNSTGAVLNFNTKLTVIVPFKVFGTVFPISKGIEVKSSYDPRF